jgi:hypothetical protein
LVGDARSIEATVEGAAALTDNGHISSFDVIVGNPPWSFKGKAGTERRRRSSTSEPAQPRGEGFDFVLRATEFAFSMIAPELPLST